MVRSTRLENSFEKILSLFLGSWNQLSSITYKVSSFEPFFGTFRTLVQNSNDKYKSIGICDLQPVLQKICRFFPDQDLRSFKILFRDMFVCWYIYLFGQKCVLCHTNQSVPFYGTLEFSSLPSSSISLYSQWLWMSFVVGLGLYYVTLECVWRCCLYFLMESVNQQNRNLGYSVSRVFSFHWLE